jgi:hypothetical protein
MDRLSRLIAYRTLVKYLVLKDIKVKSRGTYLGVAWTLMNPLVTIVTYFVVFQYVFRVTIPNFLAFFLVGLHVDLLLARHLHRGQVIENDISSRRRSPRGAAGGVRSLPPSTIWSGLAVPLHAVFWGARLSWNLLWAVVVLLAFVAFSAPWRCGSRPSACSSAIPASWRWLARAFWATPIFYNRWRQACARFSR